MSLVRLGLDEVFREQLAAMAAAPPRVKQPEGVDREPDITSEVVPIPKEWAPKEILRYRQDARRGDPMRLYGVYDEMPRGGAGPQISLSAEAIAAAEFEFAPMPLDARDETVQTAEARVGREVAEYIDEQIRPFMPNLLQAITRRVHYGLGAVSVRVEAGSGPEGLERFLEIDEIPVRRFRMDWRTFEFYFHPKARGSQLVPTAELRALGSLLLFEEGAGVFGLDQRGLLWQITLPWCVYQFGLRWWSRLGEQHGIPFRLATVAKNIENGADKAERLVKNLGAAGWGVSVDGIDVKFITALASAHAELHENLEEFCIRAFDAGILGHSQATGVRADSGGRTWAEVADSATRRRTDQQLARAAADLQRQLIRPAVVRNFGEKVAARHTPVLLMRAATPVNRLEEAEVVKASVEAGAEIPEAEFLKRIGYRSVRPGERALRRSTAAALEDPAGTKSGGKLARVVPFRARLAAQGRPPVLGADGAPSGIAEELLAPYRDIFADALNEGLTPMKALGRVVLRARERPEAQQLADALASVLVASTGHGVEAARDDREGA